MTGINDDRDQLIADLLEEAHGLRMKLEEFSQYTESKVAEFVVARKSLTKERDAAEHQHSLVQHDLEVFRRRQLQMQDDLIQMSSQIRELEVRIDQLTAERDDALARVRRLESSSAARFLARWRRRLLRI